VAVVNLGCPKNLVDGERMAGLLARQGFRITKDARQAEAVIVNTCGFVEDAKRESLEAILAAGALKRKTCRALIVSGCLAQRYARDLFREIPEADAFVGVAEIGRITGVLKGVLRNQGSRRQFVSRAGASLAFHPRRLATPKHTAYLKIGDGCDNRCAYCAIPEIRGPMRSAPLGGLIEEARELARKGVRELHLVSQDSGRYGEDLYERRRIVELLDILGKIPGIEWLRLLYLHPAHVSEQLLEAMVVNPKFCKYIDLPLQHISDRILRAMNRQVGGRRIRNLIGNIRDKIPGVTLRTTLIAGLPGETEKEFEELLAFVEETRFDRLGVFSYSAEEGTPAYRMQGQVPDDVKRDRQARLMEVQRQISMTLLGNKVGKEMKVLIDSVPSPGKAVGRSEGDALEIDGVIHLKGLAKRGEFVTARITGSDEHDLFGKIVGHEA
jgi:ribosomal protein S12 methylthiotransferase